MNDRIRVGTEANRLEGGVDGVQQFVPEPTALRFVPFTRRIDIRSRGRPKKNLHQPFLSAILR